MLHGRNYAYVDAILLGRIVRAVYGKKCLEKFLRESLPSVKNEIIRVNIEQTATRSGTDNLLVPRVRRSHRPSVGISRRGSFREAAAM